MKGVISVFANICPKESHELVAAALAGDFKKSFEMQKKYIKLMDMLFSDVNPIPIKEAMNMFGFNCGDCSFATYCYERKRSRGIEKDSR